MEILGRLPVAGVVAFALLQSGRIPDIPESAEFVQVAATVQTISYLRFTGNEFVQDHPAASIAAQRTNFILAFTPARLP